MTFPITKEKFSNATSKVNLNNCGKNGQEHIQERYPHTYPLIFQSRAKNMSEIDNIISWRIRHPRFLANQQPEIPTSLYQ